MFKHIRKYVLYIFLLIFSTLIVGQNNSSRAISQLNNSLAGQNMRIDSLDAQTHHNQQVLLPEGCKVDTTK